MDPPPARAAAASPNTPPEVGRWIHLVLRIGAWDSATPLLLTGFELQDGGTTWSAGQAAPQRQPDVPLWNVQYTDGQADAIEVSSIKSWRYMDKAPAAVALAAAKAAWGNKVRGIQCGRCGASDKELLACSACKMAYYCGVPCQKAAWKAHKPACKEAAALRTGAAKAEAKPDPRYPLANPSKAKAASQQARQRKCHALLMAALRGDFGAREYIAFGDPDEWTYGPPATFFKPSHRYAFDVPALKEDGKTGSYAPDSPLGEGRDVAKWYFNEGPRHAEGEVTSCSMFHMVSGFAHEGRCLLDLATQEQQPGLLIALAINLHTYGTCLPFSGKCTCWPGKKPLNWKLAEARLNALLRRVHADEHDTQCLYAASAEGCHAFGRPAPDGCPFRHDVA